MNKPQALLIRVKELIDNEKDAIQTYEKWAAFAAKNAVGIGWPEVNLTTMRGVSYAKLKKVVSDTYPQYTPMATGNAASMLYTFSNIDEGCLILSPYGPEDDIHIGKVKGTLHYGAIFCNDEYTNTVEVRWLRDIKRADLSPELRTALKNRRVVGNLTNFAVEIETLSKGEKYKSATQKIKSIDTPDSVEYNFPIRKDYIATFKLPRDLSSNDLIRLKAFLDSLVFD